MKPSNQILKLKFFPLGYTGENCDQTWNFPIPKHIVKYVLIPIAGVILATLLVLSVILIKRKGGLVKFNVEWMDDDLFVILFI